jgi:hypothetical protein
MNRKTTTTHRNNNSVNSVTATDRKIKVANKSKKRPKIAVEHMRIPKNDLVWARDQKPSVRRLFDFCWEADPYGSRWMPLNHDLGRTAFTKAKKVLYEAGLFIFKPEKILKDSRETVYWMVLNLHGSRVKSFWHPNVDLGGKIDHSQVQAELAAHTNKNIAHTNKNVAHTNKNVACANSVRDESQLQQGFQNLSVTPQKLLNNSSKELLGGVGDNFPQATRSLNAPFKGGLAAEGENIGAEQPTAVKGENNASSENEIETPSIGEDLNLIAEENYSEAGAELTKKSTLEKAKVDDLDPERKGNSPVDLEALKKRYEEATKEKNPSELKQLGDVLRAKTKHLLSGTTPETLKSIRHRQNLKNAAMRDRALAISFSESNDPELRAIADELPF